MKKRYRLGVLALLITLLPLAAGQTPATTPAEVAKALLDERRMLDEKGSVVAEATLSFEALPLAQKREVLDRLLALANDKKSDGVEVGRVWEIVQGIATQPDRNRADNEALFAPLVPKLKACADGVTETERYNFVRIVGNVLREESDFDWAIAAAVKSKSLALVLGPIALSSNRRVIPFLWKSLKAQPIENASDFLQALKAVPDLEKALPLADLKEEITRQRRLNGAEGAAIALLTKYPKEAVIPFAKDRLKEWLSDGKHAGDVDPVLQGLLEVLIQHQVKVPEHHAALSALALNPSTFQRAFLISRLVKVLGPRAIDDLKKIAEEKDPFGALPALGALAETVGENERLFAIARYWLAVKEIGTEDTLMLVKAAAKFGGRKAVPDLSAILTRMEKPDYWVGTVTDALAGIGPAPAAADKIIQWLKSGDTSFDRQELVESLPALLGEKELAKLEDVAPSLYVDYGEVEKLTAGLQRMPRAAAELLKRKIDFSKPASPLLTALIDVSETYRDKLPPAERDRYDHEIDQAVWAALGKQPAGPNDACEMLCRIWKSRKEWLDQIDTPAHPSTMFEFTRPYNATIGALYGLFSSMAAPYCAAPVSREQSMAEFNARKRFYPNEKELRLMVKLSEESLGKAIFKQKPSTAYQDSLEQDLRNLKGKVPQADLDRALKFASDAKGGEPLPTIVNHPTTPYLKAFLLLWHRRLLQGDKLTAVEKKVVEAEIRALEKSINEDLKNIADRQVNFAGSGLITFAYAASVAAMEHPDRNAIARMKKVAASDPLALPYLMDSSVMPDEWRKAIDSRISHRGASGRALPYHLGLYQHGGGSPEARRNLLAAVRNFGPNLSQYLLQTLRLDMHAATDGLAPYFFHPALPYYTASLQTLLNDPDVDSRVKEKELRPLLNQVTWVLVALTKATAGKPALPSAGYPNSREYITPLVGMALLPALQQCGGKEVAPSPGILVAPRPTAVSPAKGASGTH